MPIQRNQLGKNSIDRDTRNLRTRLNIQGVAGGPVTDHGLLIGLGDDDHAQYVHLSAARTITGQHSFSPASPQSPFVLGANAQGQLVSGLKAAELNKSILSSGLGLSGGGLLTASQTITLTSSSDPLSTAAILATNSSGFLKLRRLGLGVVPGFPLHLLEVNSPQVRIGYNGSNYLDISIGSSGDATYNVVGTTPQHQFSDSIVITDLVGPQLAVRYDASNYLTVSIDNSGNGTFLSAGSQASLILAPAGDIIVDPTGNDVLPLTTYDINLGAINKKYLTLHAAELWVQTLVAQEVLATIGGRVLVGPTTILEEDLIETNMIVNGGFENRTIDDFDNWTETEGSGAIIALTSGVYSGSSAVIMTRGATDDTNMKSDNIPVTPGDLIFCDLRYKTSGSAGGRWLIWDFTNTALIVFNLTGTETAWTYDHATFAVPAGCTEIYWELRPSGSVATTVSWDHLQMWPGTIVVKHNQMDFTDTAVLEKNGFVEFIRINALGIDSVDIALEYIFLLAEYGDITSQFPENKYFAIRGSTGNDGTYSVNSADFISSKTRLTVFEDVSNAVGDGYIAWSSNSPTVGPYTFFRPIRDLDGTGQNAWDVGDAVFNTGQTGDGFIDLYSVAGLISGAGPTITGNVRQSETFNDIEERWAIGNLNGLYGYAADEYGVAIGEPAGTRITIEPVSGIQFYSNNSIVGQFDLAGGFWIGEGAADTRLSFDIVNGLQIFNSSNQRVMRVGLTGEFYVGTSINQERLTWDSTNGLRLFNNAGTAIISFPTSGDAKIIGTLAVITGGEVTGATGKVVIDERGITISAAESVFNELTSLSWAVGGTPYMEVYQIDTGSINAGSIFTRRVTSRDSYTLVRAEVNSGDQARVTITAERITASNVAIDMVNDSTDREILFGNFADPVKFLFNDTANTKNTGGITISQQTLDNEILSLKASEANHLITDITETDTYGYMKKVSATLGGLDIVGLGNTTYQIGVLLQGIAGVSTTTTSTGAVAPTLFAGWQRSSSNIVALASADNVLVMRNGGLSRWILKGDGEIHSDFHSGGATGHANYDDYNDAELLRTFDIQHSSLETADAWFNNNLQALQDLGIIHDVRPDGMFVSQQKITKLQIGAIWQLYQRIEELEQQVRRI